MPKLLRLSLAATFALVMAVASTFASHAFDATSAAGLWQKTERGKPTGWFLVVDRDGTFEGVIAKMFSEPGEEPNPICSKCSDDRKDMPGLAFHSSAT